jgi:hypothetical protein
MSKTAYEQIRRELHPTERLLWSGRPRRGIRFNRGEAVRTCLFVVGGVLLFLLWRAAGGGGVVLALIYLFVLCGIVDRVVVDAWRRRKTYYGLTDRRAIVVDGLFNQQVRSLPLRPSPKLSLREGGNRYGTILCSPGSGHWYKKNRRGMIVPRPLFRMIVDARHVYNLMLDAQAKPPASR